MRIALLADIHSNLSALQAVLSDMPAVDSIYCLGDVVGYYADPNEVCELLQERNIRSIRGNHDAYVLGDLLPHPDRAAAYRTMWTRETLSPENMAWIRSLPKSLEINCGRLHVQLLHASPWGEEDYLYPDSDRLREISLGPDEFLALGHTHWPMLRQCGEGFVLNPGSVGQPRDCNPEAAYAIVNCDSRHVEFRRVRYDVTGLQERLRTLGWNPATIAILSRTSRSGNEDSQKAE